MTIEIVSAEKIDTLDGGQVWACWLEVSDGGQSRLLPATAPGSIVEAGLQAHFDARDAELIAVATAKGLPVVDIYGHVAQRQILKAFASVVLDEINILRGQHGLVPRTAEQLRQALKSKL